MLSILPEWFLDLYFFDADLSVAEVKELGRRLGEHGPFGSAEKSDAFFAAFDAYVRTNRQDSS